MEKVNTPKKLYRLSEGKKISGVCSGLGDYFAVDPIIPRAILLASLFLGGAGVILYLIFHFTVPEKEE